MQVHRSAADLIKEYYRVKDSYHEAIDYYQMLDNITQVCINNFERNNLCTHPLVEMFLVLISQENNILRLDSIGADEIADHLQISVTLLDSTLRAMVSKIIDHDIIFNEAIDQDFIYQFDIQKSNALWFEFHNKKDKK